MTLRESWLEKCKTNIHKRNKVVKNTVLIRGTEMYIKMIEWYDMGI